jgi:DNA gyrase/topoisomerase IV subunit B
MEERLKALSIAYPAIRFSFNGAVIRVKKPEEYFNTLYSIKVSENVWYGLGKSNGSFDTSSIVNGLIVPSGGSHIDYFVSSVCNELSAILKRRKKVEVSPSKLKSYLNCYAVIVGFPALKFDSQTKTKITNSLSEVKAHVGDIDFAKVAGQLFKSEDLISDILAYTRFQEDLEAKKALDKLDKPKKKIQSDKLLDSVGKMKRLWLCEGLSAQGGLSPAFGRQGNAYFAMKGVPLSSWSASHQEMAANAELGLIYQLIKNSDSDLEIIIASDADSDGSHICGILISFFKRYFDTLIENGKIKILKTPIAVVNDSKGLPTNWVYSFSDIKSLKGSVSYKKGLGSWTAKTLMPVIAKDGFEAMVVTVSTVSGETLDNWFLTEKSQTRKELIQIAPAFNIMTL